MTEEKASVSKSTLADPSALGLFGLSVITLVACTQKFDITTGVTGVMSWTIFLGGCMQLIAGIIDLKKNNVFGGTAFVAYGFFWIAMSFSWSIVQVRIFSTSISMNLSFLWKKPFGKRRTSLENQLSYCKQKWTREPRVHFHRQHRSY